ncbi:MAG: formylmethanofuran dehydrogenase subunit E family protein [Acidimicrobiales bacterium]
MGQNDDHDDVAPSRVDVWYVADWLEEARRRLVFEVRDTRSAQGRLETHVKRVTLDDLVLFHGHACDGLLRGAYAMRALGDVAFGAGPFDRSDLEVVSKNSPCLGDVAAYLTGGRARFGTHRLDDSLGVGFVVREVSTGRTWEVREEPGFFPALISAWEAALLDDDLVNHGYLRAADKAELIAVNEARQWTWVRQVLLGSRPSDHYVVRALEGVELPEPIHRGRRSDVVNRDAPAPAQYASPYEPLMGAGDPPGRIAGSPWEERYDEGPPQPRA